MKRTISLLSILAFVLAFSGNAFAQEDVTVSASVVSPLSYTNTANLNFGQIPDNAGSDPAIVPGGTNVVVSDSASYGQIDVSGGANATILINFNSVPTNLSGGTGGPLGFTANFTGNTSGTPTGSDDDLDESTSVDNEVTLDGSGNYYIYYGGSITNADLSGASGSFSGTISTTISYE